MPGYLQRLATTLFPPKPPQTLTISAYGQDESGLEMAAIQPVMEWVGLSLQSYGYLGEAHLFWMHPDSEVGHQLERLYQQGEPVLGYRLGDRMATAPEGLYWRLMGEHPSMRIYQLEEQEAG